MFISSETMPAKELSTRHARCRALLDKHAPEASGLLVFSRPGVYYLSGVMGAGIFWLPKEGEPLLMVRKGRERANLDSPHLQTAQYRRFDDIQELAAERGAPLGRTVAVEQAALPWALADNLKNRLPDVSFLPGDAVITRARAVKTQWELAKMREAAKRHAETMEVLLPRVMHPGMTEIALAKKTLDLFIELGGFASTRMSNFGEELILGSVSAGDNGNYPTFYNGPLGGVGMHPSTPFLGCPKTVWAANNLLMIDVGFSFEGYNSDKSITYFSGSRRDIPAIAQKAHGVCCRIEEEAAENLRPGTLPMNLYKKAVAAAEKAGFGANFMGYGANQVPFLGHGIGLCIDDWPPIADRFDMPIEEGMTFALEPKIGLPGLGMVGTENTWLVGPDGAECLSGKVCDIVCIE